jgi:hypothetical protein
VLLRTHSEPNLRDAAAVDRFFATARVDHVFLAAAKVGGIRANDTYPADFLRDNLQIQTNVIDAAWRNGVQKLLFLGSRYIYPKLAPQPIGEESLLTGPLEPTGPERSSQAAAGSGTAVRETSSSTGPTLSPPPASKKMLAVTLLVGVKSTEHRQEKSSATASVSALAARPGFLRSPKSGGPCLDLGMFHERHNLPARPVSAPQCVHRNATIRHALPALTRPPRPSLRHRRALGRRQDFARPRAYGA